MTGVQTCALPIYWVDEARARRALEQVEFLIVLDSDGCEGAQYANVILPLATYAESDGTFTNHAGRVQRFAAAVQPPGEARPGVRVLGGLLQGVSLAAGADAEVVFGAMADELPELRGIEWPALGGRGVCVDASV